MAVNLATITTLTRARLYQGQPASSAATVYTVPATTDVAVKSVVLCNTTANPNTVTLYLVPSGATAGVANAVLSGFQVPGNSTTVVDLTAYMTTGDFLAALQGVANAVTVTISGETYA